MANLPKSVSYLFAIVLSAALAAAAQANSNDVVLYASKAPVRAGTWVVTADSTAAGGYLIQNPDLGAAKLLVPLAKPTNYFEITFSAYAGLPYHLWIRSKSANNSTSNDSVYAQFSDSVNDAGSAIDRIGTTSAEAVVLQACTGAPESGWGWSDNGWCAAGKPLYFQTTGTHTLRVQVREDGLSIDQIVLSPQTFLSNAPGARVTDVTLLAANQPVLSSAQVTIQASSTTGSAPLAVSFTPTVTLASGSVNSYNWSFGDGQVSTEQQPTHVYQKSGNYNSKLAILDSAGTLASAAMLVSVSGAASTTKLRVVQANISYGGHGTDNVLDLNRTTDWLVQMDPDAASLTEVIGGWNDPALITSLMEQKTGVTWYSAYVPKYTACPEGVMVLSKWPIVSSAQYFMSYQMPIVETTLNVNGKLISFFATHFQWPNTAAASAQRQEEAKELVSFASTFPEPRIIAGDLNAQVGTPEMSIILAQYVGGWDKAVSEGTAVAYADNPVSMGTRTRRSRIDHVLYSKGATGVSVTGGGTPDQRAAGTSALVTVKIGTADDKGVRPSDHNFTWVSFDIN
jgi:PKD repeat protein/endonuclease/exonuclease/phosphatase family metal-dependent hydrolase